jgi:hypothetical protein
MDEYMAKSKRCSTIRIFNEHREQDFKLDFSLNEELYGPFFVFVDWNLKLDKVKHKTNELFLQ